MILLKRSEFLNYFELPSTGKTKIIGVATKEGNMLAVIKWYGAWRKYCFHPERHSVFDTKCLLDIVEFIKELMDERKVKL